MSDGHCCKRVVRQKRQRLTVMIHVSSIHSLTGSRIWSTLRTHLLNGSTFEPVTLSIYTCIGEFSQNWGEAMALAVFAVLPAAMLLIAAQRYIAAGLMVGFVKG